MKDFYLLHFDEVDSTNEYLKKHYAHLPTFTVVSADSQYAGKGRLGRNWENLPKQNLMMSILIKTDYLALEKYSQLMGASVYLALKEYGILSQIKWPNDILIYEKKVSGILCEAITKNEKIECVILGIGVNVNATCFTKELKNKATSLYLQTGNKYSLDELQAKILHHFKILYQQTLFDDFTYLQICKENNALLNKEIVFQKNGVTQTGIVIDLLENGNLYVKANQDYIELHSGEVTLQQNYE